MKHFLEHRAIRGAVCQLAIAVAVLSNGLAAETSFTPPERMTYQGFLVDANGTVLGKDAPSNYPVTFKVFDHQTESSAVNLLWSERQIVTVDKGQFSVLLGEGSSVAGEEDKHGSLSKVFSGETASDRFIELTVEVGQTKSTIAPRLRFLTSPYAFLSRSATTLVSPNGTNIIETANELVTIDGETRARKFKGDGSGLTNLVLLPTDIPLLDSGKISSGVLATERIPNLPASKITSGTLDSTRLPMPLSLGSSLHNSKIKLWESGNTVYGLGIQGSQFRLHLGSNADRFSFLDSADGNELMTVRGNGNVGIGTASPSQKLDVNGNVRVIGNLEVGGQLTMGGSRPIFTQWFRNLGDDVFRNTGISASAYECGIIGLWTGSGDIQEGGSGNIMMAFTYISGNIWHIRAEFRTHNDPENWDIQLLCIDTRLARAVNR